MRPTKNQAPTSAFFVIGEVTTGSKQVERYIFLNVNEREMVSR